MIVSVGVDAVEIERIQALLERSGERFERRVFTPSEADYCRGRQRPAESFAARFAFGLGRQTRTSRCSRWISRLQLPWRKP